MEERFVIAGVVFATKGRRDHFRNTLSGQTNKRPITFKSVIKDILRISKRIIKNAMGYPVDRTKAAITLCKKHNIPFLLRDDVNSQESLDIFKDLQPDLILSAAYPQIFKKKLIDLAPLGAINSHPSLLPKYRGAHPHFWAIAKGEKETGITMHYMTEILDAGDTIVQIPIIIDKTDNYSNLYNKIVSTIPQLFILLIDFFQSGMKSTPQDHEAAEVFRNDREIHHCVLWSTYSAEQICDLVRACDGKAYFWMGSAKVFINECSAAASNRNLTNNINVPPGTIVDNINGKLSVKAKTGIVILHKYKIIRNLRGDFPIGKRLI